MYIPVRRLVRSIPSAAQDSASVRRIDYFSTKSGRSLYFTPRETLIYGYLFDLADTDDDGLVGGADGGHAFLSRARLPSETLQRLWSEAGGGSPDACLARPQWFVLLALVGLAQAGLPCTLRDLLDSCDGSVPQVSHGGPWASSSSSSSSLPSKGMAQQQQRLPQANHHQRVQHQSPMTVQMQIPVQQAQQQAARAPAGASHGGTPRPIPDFYLDGGAPVLPRPRMQLPAGSQQTPAERGGTESRRYGTRGREEYDLVEGGSVTGELGGPEADWEDVSSMEGDDNYHLEITVYSHRVVGEGYGSHTEYTVLANASVPRFARRELEVSRRYSDFRWLHGCFKALPGVLTPPLPPSKWAGSSNRDFVAERMKGLQRYMTRVAQHPVLRRQYALQVFLEGTPRGLRAAKVLLPGGLAIWSESLGVSPQGGPSTGVLSNGPGFAAPVSPALSSSSGSTPPEEHAGFVRRRFSLGGVDDTLAGGGGGGVVVGIGVAGAGGAPGNVRHGQRRSLSFGNSSDDGMPSGLGGSSPGSGVMTTWTGGGVGPGGGATLTTWPLSVVANAGYEAYGNYVASSLTSIKGVIGAVKTRARTVVGFGAGPAPISVEPDLAYDAEVAHIEELVAPLSGAVKMMESSAVLKRGVGYEMSRLGHYLTQVASLEDADGVPGSPSYTGTMEDVTSSSGRRYRGGGETTNRVGVSVKGGGGAALAKAEQVLGQRMEKVATAWLEAIDHEESEFLDPLREQLGYLSSAKEVHRGRVRSLEELQAANASLQRNKQRLHAARAQGDSHAASVATGKMEAAEDRMTNSETRAVRIARTFKAEAKRFHDCRRSEGIAAILELARAQATFARKANAAWKQVLEDINPTDEELKQSQERVQLPRREVRIGEGKSRSGRSLGGWIPTAALGAARATAGVSGGAVGVGGPGRGYVASGMEGRSNSENGSVARGQSISGASHGRVRSAGVRDGGFQGAGDVATVSRVLHEERVRETGMGMGMGMGTDVRLGSGVERERAMAAARGGGLWADEEHSLGTRPYDRTHSHSRASAAASTSLPFNDDWEPLEPPPPGIAAVDREDDASARAQPMPTAIRSSEEDVSTALSCALASSAAPALDSRLETSEAVAVVNGVAVGTPSTGLSGRREREGNGDDNKKRTPIANANGRGGSVGTRPTSGRSSRRSSRREAMSKNSVSGARWADGASPRTDAPSAPSVPKAQHVKSDDAKLSGDATAPPTPSDTIATGARPTTALSLMDSLEAMSSSGDAEGPGCAIDEPPTRRRGECKEEGRPEDSCEDQPGIKLLVDRDSLLPIGGAGSSGKLESGPSYSSARPGSVVESGDGIDGSVVAEVEGCSEMGAGSVECVGSGSGTGSGGVAVSAPTTVVRLAGSPNPAHRRARRGARVRGADEDGAEAKGDSRGLSPDSAHS